MRSNHWHPDNKPRRWKRSQVGTHARVADLLQQNSGVPIQSVGELNFD